MFAEIDTLDTTSIVISQTDTFCINIWECDVIYKDAALTLDASSSESTYFSKFCHTSILFRSFLCGVYFKCAIFSVSDKLLSSRA